MKKSIKFSAWALTAIFYLALLKPTESKAQASQDRMNKVNYNPQYWSGGRAGVMFYGTGGVENAATRMSYGEGVIPDSSNAKLFINGSIQSNGYIDVSSKTYTAPFAKATVSPYLSEVLVKTGSSSKDTLYMSYPLGKGTNVYVKNASTDTLRISLNPDVRATLTVIAPNKGMILIPNGTVYISLFAAAQ